MPQTQPRKSTNLSLDLALVDAARALDINLSRAAEDGIRIAVAKSLQQRWKAENRDALESSNQFVEKHGLPLDALRRF